MYCNLLWQWLFRMRLFNQLQVFFKGTCRNLCPMSFADDQLQLRPATNHVTTKNIPFPMEEYKKLKVKLFYLSNIINVEIKNHWKLLTTFVETPVADICILPEEQSAFTGVRVTAVSEPSDSDLCEWWIVVTVQRGEGAGWLLWTCDLWPTGCETNRP